MIRNRTVAYLIALLLLSFTSSYSSQYIDFDSNTNVKDSFCFHVFTDSISFNTDDSSAANNVFIIWDHTKVDPYHVDLVKKTDTTVIYLGDSTTYSYPVLSRKVNSNFGYRRYRYHYGIDLELVTGDPVYNSFNGVVRYAKYVGGYGKCVVVTHYNGLETVYGHLSSILVGVGDSIKNGDLIGLGGSTGRATGSHLHYEIRFMGQQIDPNKIIDFSSGKLRSEKLLVCKDTYDYLVELRKIKYHTIRSGDSLWKISKKYGVSISKLCQLNHISRNSVLRVGRRLRYQ